MARPEQSQQGTEAYDHDTKVAYETTLSLTTSSNSSIHQDVKPEKQDEHAVAFADLEPSASVSIPPQVPHGSFDPAFEVKWADDDVENPKNWSFWRKTHTLIAISLASCTVVLYSSAYTAGISGTGSMTAELGVSSTVSLLGLTTYLFGMAAGSLIWAPVSEMLGRRTVYICTFFAFLLFILPCALAKNIQTVIICRFFAAVFGTSMVSNAPGTINDISTDQHRAFSFGIWCLGSMNGPIVGPLIGGYVFDQLGWRWIHWIVLIINGVSFLMVATMPETYPPALLRRRAEKKRKATGNNEWWSKHDEKREFLPLLGSSLLRPLHLTMSEPILWFWDLYILIVYAMNFLTFVIYPKVFEGMRGWSVGQTGLSYLGIGAGNVLAIACEPLLRRMVMQKRLDVQGRPTPESPVFIVCIGAILIPIGGLWFAWTCTPDVHFIWPILSGIPFGAGTTATFIYGSNYIGRSYGMYAASAMAGNVVTRTIAGGTLPLAGTAMYNSLGPHWQGTLLGLLEVAIIPIPFVFYKYGHLIRLKSKFIQRLEQESRGGEKGAA